MVSLYPRAHRWNSDDERRFEPTDGKGYASHGGNGKDLVKRQRVSTSAAIADFSNCSQCDASLGLKIAQYCSTWFENHALAAEARIIRQAENRVATVDAEMLTVATDLENRAKLLATRESEVRRLQERADTLENEKVRMLTANQELRTQLELKGW